MSTRDVATAITHYYTGEFTQDEIELILRSYEPLFTFYTALLRGTLDDRALLTNDAVRVFLLYIDRGANLEHALGWVIKSCRRLSAAELRACVVEAFFKAINIHGAVQNYQRYLAENLRELLGDAREVLATDLRRDEFSADEPFEQLEDAYDLEDDVYDRLMAEFTGAERLFHERGILLTAQERAVIRAMSQDESLRAAAETLGISHQRVHQILTNLRGKAARP